MLKIVDWLNTWGSFFYFLKIFLFERFYGINYKGQIRFLALA